MIQVKVKRDRNKLPVLVEIRGHALFAPHGSDIICAAVSVLAQTTVFAMEDLLDTFPAVKIKKGSFRFCRPVQLEPERKEGFFLLFEALILGLREIAKTYPKNIFYQEDSRGRYRKRFTGNPK